MIKISQIGEATGYILSYLIFTTILFYILTFLNKLPADWHYGHVMIITFIVATAGVFTKRLLR